MSSELTEKELLKELLKWIRFDGIQKAKKILENTLDTDIKKLTYELSDGKSSPEIADMVQGIDEKTIRNYWKDWSTLGIVEIHPQYKKRYRKIFSLREFGIETPELKIRNNKTAQPTECEE